MNLARYQLAVVGAGSAGLASAALAAELGARVVLIERDQLGGDRLRYRVPAAAVIRAAHDRTRRGAEIAEDDFANILTRARELRATTDNARNLSALGVDVVRGEARFVAADALEVQGQRLEFRRALIATGAQTAIPRVPGLEDVRYRTPETLFELPERPERLGVLGAGSRGCEMAQTFAQLGSEVHLFVAHDQLLTERDPDAAEIVVQALREDGLELHFNSRDLQVRWQDEIRIALPEGGVEVAVDELLVATGPQSNVKRLGLEAAGVDYDLSGIAVNRHLRTTNRRIFAAGSVAVSKERGPADSSSGLAADADARTAVRNALLFRRLERRRSTVPRATYTRPEVVQVGIGAQEATTLKGVETLTVPLADTERSGLLSETPSDGFLRLYLKRKSGEVLGGTLVAEGAAELIGPLAIAVNRRLRLGVFTDISLPHPTRGEIYRRAAFMWQRQVARRRRARGPWLSGPANLWFKLTSRF